ACRRGRRRSPRSAPGSRLALELGAHPRQDAGCGAAIEQLLDGGPAGGAVAARPVVDVHADEAIRKDLVPLELAGVAAGEGERFGAVVERPGDRLGEQPAEPPAQRRIEIAPDAVAPQRQRAAGLLLPPGAEVDQRLEAPAAEGQL